VAKEFAFSLSETEAREFGGTTSSALEEETEDFPFFCSEGCVVREVQAQLKAEYRTRGLYSFLLYGWNNGQSQSFTHESLLPTFVIDSYIRYINYVLVPYAKKEMLFVKPSYYVFPVGLIRKFFLGGSYYSLNNLPPAERLLEKDFWLIPHMNTDTKRWSLVVICYPNEKEKTFFAVLDSKSITLDTKSNPAFVTNLQTFFRYQHILAASAKKGSSKEESSFNEPKISNPEVIWVNVPQEEETSVDNSGHYLM